MNDNEQLNLYYAAVVACYEQADRRMAGQPKSPSRWCAIAAQLLQRSDVAGLIGHPSMTVGEARKELKRRMGETVIGLEPPEEAA